MFIFHRALVLFCNLGQYAVTMGLILVIRPFSIESRFYDILYLAKI